jgi:uncharacterized repeat protein (TIGR02543 family)
MLKSLSFVIVTLFVGFVLASCSKASISTSAYVSPSSSPYVSSTGLTLTISNSNVTGGTVTSVDGSISCGTICSANFTQGGTVTLLEIPAAGYNFTGWTGACTGSTTCTVTMSSAQSVTAIFALVTNPRTLTVTNSNHIGGTVTSSSGGINCGTTTCSASFSLGSSVTLTATPAVGYNFTGWSGGGCSGTNFTCTVSMSSAQSVTATFTLNSSQSILAITNINGAAISPFGVPINTVAGAITSSPSGIACGTAGSTCSAGFTQNNAVTLTAAPATNYTFGGWGGACSGISTSCTITMTNANSVTASFVANVQPSNQLGFNFGPPIDYSEDRPFADMMKTSRPFYSATSTSTLATTDAVGWPTQDFTFYVVAGLDKLDGTYAISFTGQATVSALLSPGGHLGTLTYNSGTNTTSGTFTVTGSDLIGTTCTLTSPCNGVIALTFTNTKRLSGDTAGNGITNLIIMRPSTPGSSTPLPSGTIFNPSSLAYLNSVSTIRLMDFTATNWNQQVNWSDRMLPSSPSFNRNPGGIYGWEGLGAAWEYAILLANAANKDVWINMPQLATDAYYTNVAYMFKYGSDGTNPYTSTQANPVYPPLNPNLHVYVEYGNEVWNGSFPSLKTSINNAGIELNTLGTSAPIDWDHIWNSTTETVNASGFTVQNTDLTMYVLAYRNYAEHVVNMSNDWRLAWCGALVSCSAMGTTVRPVLMGQLGGGQTFDSINMLMNFYNNLSGHGAGTGAYSAITPHPPSYYIYAAGDAPYYSPITITPSSNIPGTADAVFADGMTTANVAVGNELTETYYTMAAGVHHDDYEGGPGLDTTSSSTVNNAYTAAVLDTRMTGVVENLHNAFTANGVELLNYLTSTGNYEWGFSYSLYDMSEPKIAGIEALDTSNASVPAIGTAIPGSVAGAGSVVCSRSYSCGGNAYLSTLGATQQGFNWASYPFHATTAASRTITITFSSAASAQVAVYVDGVQVGTTQSTNGSNTTLTYSAGTMGVGLHGVVVNCVAGTFSISSVAVN